MRIYRLLWCIFLIHCLTQNTFAQSGFQYRSQRLVVPIHSVVDLKTDVADYDPKLVNIKKTAPAPLSLTAERKINLDQQRTAFSKDPSVGSFNKTAAPAPSVLAGFEGNITQGTPNDNDLAIGNNGRIVSVMNTNMTVYSDSGRFIFGRSLAAFARTLGSLNRTYDPRVIYDPKKDRFILVFLQGVTSADTRIIIAFSQNNLPEDKWNFYVVPGNVTGDASWSDYPILSLSDDDLFITVNRVKDNTPWQTGFITSYIWQLNKETGYNGDTLKPILFDSITYNGRSIWNVCPVKGGPTTNNQRAWFLSQRPSDLENDTVFLHTLIYGKNGGRDTLVQHLMRTNKPYGLQPNAIQPNGKKLQTNDARILSACYANGFIHYVGNTINKENFAPSIYYGIVKDVWGNSPSVTGSIISYDTMDIGYPSITYVGGGPGDNSMMVTFSHVSPSLFPGTSVVYSERFGNISPPVIVKNGAGNIEVINDSINRWGDYTGNQTKYNELGVCWISGSFGGANKQNQTWIAKIKSNDPLLSNPTTNTSSIIAKLYPNPTPNYATFEFEMQQSTLVTFTIMDINGKMVTRILKDKAKAGSNRFTFSVDDLPSGTYFLQLQNENNKTIYTHKFLVQH